MRNYICLLLLVILTSSTDAQELYVFTEPASNMPARSIGIRLTHEGMSSGGWSSRTIPEMMIGVNKKLMFHLQGFFSDMDGDYRAEGASIYGKYRFLSVDGLKTHSRMAAFARVSQSKRTFPTSDINLEGDNSGMQGGLIFTQLLHKLALSANVSYSKAFGRDRYDAALPGPDKLIGYSVSSGYLLLPFVYKDYNQPNFNLYFEVLGKTNPADGHFYVDLAPAVQMVINSRTRIDLGYRFQMAGNMAGRYTRNMYLARVEFNFFNVLR